jgi:hypothetical protein
MTARSTQGGNKTSIQYLWPRPQHVQCVVLDLRKDNLTEHSKKLSDQRIPNFPFVHLELLSVFYPPRNPNILNSVCTPCTCTDRPSVTLS